MDQDNNNKSEVNHQGNDLVEPLNQDEPQLDNDQEPKPQIIVKKSGNKLALLCSILALLASAFLLYLAFYQKQTDHKHADLSSQFDSLKATNEQLKKQLHELNQSHASNSQNFQEQISALQQEPKPQADGGVFDNNENEEALSQLEQRMDQQISNHAKTITELKLQIQATQNSNAIAHEVLPETTEVYDRKRAIDALYAADLLIRTQRLPQAVSTLQQLMATANLSTGTQQSINHLIMQWQQVKQPDTNSLEQQLQQFKQQVRQLKLSTQQLDEPESDSWYSRFVSVKKIAADSGLADSHALRLLQAELTQQLLQAEWALTLQQSDAWQTHLLSAVTTLKQQMPQETTLAAALQELSSQNIVALMPTPSGIHDLISQLKGRR